MACSPWNGTVARSAGSQRTEVFATMICLQKGESGYTISDWNTDDPDHNRKLATYRNQKRGITPEQEQAMLNSLASISSSTVFLSEIQLSISSRATV